MAVLKLLVNCQLHKFFQLEATGYILMSSACMCVCVYSQLAICQVYQYSTLLFVPDAYISLGATRCYV